MRAAVSLMTQVIFVGLLVVLVLTFVLRDVMTPAMTSYGEEHAKLAARSIAISANALSTQEHGTVERELGLAWNIRVFHEDGSAYVTVTHEKFESGEIPILGNVEDFEAIDTNEIIVLKEPDSKVRFFTRDDYNKRAESPEGRGE